MRVKLTNSGGSEAMERHYQRLIEAGWKASVTKETRIIKGFKSSWDVEDTEYWLDLNSEIESDLLFDLSDVLMQELVLYSEKGQPVIEIYDDYRE